MLIVFDPSTGKNGGLKEVDYDDLRNGEDSGYGTYFYSDTIYCEADYSKPSEKMASELE